MGVFNKKELDKINELENTIKTLREEIKDANIKYQFQLEDKNEVIKKLENDLKEADEINEKNIEMFTNHIKKYDVKLLDAINNNKRLCKINEKCKSELEQFKYSLDKKEELENKVQSLNKECERKTNILKEANEKIQKLNKELEEKENKKEELENNVKELEEKYTKDKEEFEERLSKEEERKLEEMNSRLESFENSINNLIETNILDNPYSYETSEEFQEKLNNIREEQKQMIKDNRAIKFSTTWAIGNSNVKGLRFMKSLAKLVLRAFNGETTSIIMGMKYSTISSCKERIEKSYKMINKLVTINDCVITEEYLQLKIDELMLKAGYLNKREEEKEELRRQNEILREQQRVEEEIKLEEEKIEIEETHFNNELAKLQKQLKNEKADKKLILGQIKKLQEKIEELQERKENVLDRKMNNKAGYVYIISNPSLEGMVKIGVTRRLDPQIRVDELSSASVPFKFGVHSFIFDEDAFALENTLHKAFDDKRVNKANHHKEFFEVSLEEVKQEVKKYNPTAQFIDEVLIEEYELTKQMEDK